MKRFPIGNPIRASHERGGILVIAIIVILAMLIMAIPFLFKLSAQWRTTEKGSHSLAAFNLAEAGVERTMYYLDPDSPVMSDPENIIWTFEGSNQVGVINNIKSANATIMGNVNLLLGPPYGTTPPRRNLDSTGTVPFIADRPVNRSVRVNLEQFYKSIFDVGFFVDEYFYVRNSFFLDAYNSKDGAYGAPLAGGGTNSLLPDVYFGSNSYISDTNPKNPGDATWTIESGGGSSEVHGTIMAGGDAAEAFKNGTALNPPDPSLIGDVISVPTDDIFQGTEDRLVMKQEYDLPPVDVFNLPPKEILGTIPNVGEWFEGYTLANPDAAAYYANRFTSAPSAGEIIDSYEQGTFTGSGNLTPADNGLYTSFMIGGYKTPGTLNISGGDVVIYVTSYGDVTKAGNFYMGKNSSINIAPDSSLTMILGNTSVTVEQGYNINNQGSPPQAANCVILGTNQFTIPANQNVGNLPNKADSVDKLRIPGLMYFEHAQSEGTIYSAMYVPGAHVTTGQGQNHMNFYGALISKSMDFKVQVDFHYDKALADLKLVTGGYENWKIISWQEVLQ
jgi:hypothetical protein